ncbi:MAG: exodeoxyribonuclease V subunit alpha [Polyangia bacterium]
MIARVEDLLAAGHFSRLDAELARTVVRLAGHEDPLLALGVAETSRATAAGSVCADLRRLGGGRVDLEIDTGDPRPSWPVAESWIAALESSPAVGDGNDHTPLVLDGAGRLYLHRYWNFQHRLAREVLARCAAPSADDSEVDPKDLERLFPAAADPGIDPRGRGVAGQREAARIAVGGLLTVISGGPGTGKTTTVARILALLAERALARGEAPPRIALLAPTGKAAARLAESIRRSVDPDSADGISSERRALDCIPREAATIHRALGWNPRGSGRMRFGLDNPLFADVVVVDECSMVDLALLAQLVEAVPRRARLILVGDRNQLASVEAGAAFGDICGGAAPEADGAPRSALVGRVAQLEHSFRFGAGIGDLAAAINSGDPRRTLEVLDDPELPQVRLVDEGDPERRVRRAVELAVRGFSLLLRREDPADRLKELRRFRLLAAHRRGPDGAERLAAEVESKLLRLSGIAPALRWYSGRPVMILRNDYELEVYNGDDGVAVVDDQGRVWLWLDSAEGIRSVAAARLPAHQTAYATTVHKAQGSELEEVAVLLPRRSSPVLSRELLYTAVTRARRKVVLLASREQVAEAVATPVERPSGLRDELSV